MLACRETCKPAHRLWIAIPPHRDEMHTIPHIDSCCMPSTSTVLATMPAIAGTAAML
jgi:hypothetical protein